MQQIFREIKSNIDFRKNSNPDFPAHVHDDIELVYTKRGKGIAYCDGKKYILEDHSWFLVFPNQVHHYTDFQPGEYYVLIIKATDLLRYNNSFMEGVPHSALHCFQNTDDDGLSWLLETAYREFLRDGFSEIIAAYLTALYGKLLPFYKIERDVSHSDNVQKILQYCSTHYHEDLTIAAIADALSVSRSCVSHIFSSRICMNFCDYINSLRLSEAEEILRNPGYCVTEAATMSGFPTIRTFNRAFLKKHGISPSAYRRRSLNSGAGSNSGSPSTTYGNSR